MTQSIGFIEILAPFLSAFVAEYLPTDNYTLKLQFGMVISQLLSKATAIFSYFAKFLKLGIYSNDILISAVDESGNKNQLYFKIMKVLVGKYCNDHNQELIFKNGEIDFNIFNKYISNTVKDEQEIDGKKYKFHIYFQKSTRNLIPTCDSFFYDKENIDVPVIRIKCNLRGNEGKKIIKKYIKYLGEVKQDDSSGTLSIFTHSKSSVKNKKDTEFQKVFWEENVIRTNKTVDNTILSEENQRMFYQDLNDYILSEDYYRKMGIPYKRGYILTGLPGTGKTSSIKAVANKYGFDIFVIELSSLTSNDQLIQLTNSIPNHCRGEKHILVFEDFDKSDFVKEKPKDPFRYYSREDNKKDKITLDCFLNVLDGVMESYGRITIISANNMTPVMDTEALVRPGRVDVICDFGNCTATQIQRIISLFFPDQPLDNIDFTQYQETITPSKLINIILSHKNDFGKFMEVMETMRFQPPPSLDKNPSSGHGGAFLGRRNHRFGNTHASKLKRLESKISETTISQTKKQIEKLKANIQKEKDKKKKEMEKKKKLKKNALKKEREEIKKLKANEKEKESILLPNMLRQTYNIPEEKLTFPKLLDRVFSYHQDNHLIDPEDKRILRANIPIAQLYGMSIMKINKSNDPKDPDGLNFSNLCTRLMDIVMTPDETNKQLLVIGELVPEEHIPEKPIPKEPKSPLLFLHHDSDSDFMEFEPDIT